MAFWAYGSLFKVENAAMNAFATLASVKSIGGPSLEADTVDVTNFDSTGGFEEIIPTLLRAGEVSLEMNYLPQDATQGYGTNGLMDLWRDRTNRCFQIWLSDTDTTVWEFQGYVTKIEINAAVAEALSMNVTVKVTGAPKFGKSSEIVANYKLP